MDVQKWLTIFLISGAVWVLFIIVHLTDQESRYDVTDAGAFQNLPLELPHYAKPRPRQHREKPVLVNDRAVKVPGFFKKGAVYKIPDEIKGKVSCGGHRVPRCENCGKEELMCNGQCQWNRERRVCEDPSREVVIPTTVAPQEFIEPTQPAEERQGLFISNVSIRKVVNGKNSDDDKLRRYHGWLALDDDGNPLYTPTPLSKPISTWTKEEVEQAHHGYQFNRNASDSFPMDREYGRYFADPLCYSKVTDFHESGIKMDASIIFVYHNEYFTTLVRSIHGILNKTPPEYLREIVLIDDGSDLEIRPWLGEKLKNYLMTLPKIVYKRNEERLGLMGARMAGADAATSDNLIFLDSHIEPADGYIEPLLQYLSEDYRHVAVPIIDSIQATDFSEKAGGISILAFTWTLGQTGVYRKESKVDNMDTPIMAGGLFAITRRWLDELGRYDSELKQWGGEESEISFKIWMCGGRLACVPCSHIGHVFRDTEDSKQGAYKLDYNLINRNKIRVAMAWMDEYAGIAKLGLSALPSNYTIGDLGPSLAIKEKLQCKNFDWYLKNIYPEMSAPQLDGSSVGALVSVGKKDWCLDVMGAKNANNPMGVFPCHWTHGTQAFILSGDGNVMAFSISNASLCVGIATSKEEREKDAMRAIKCSEDTKWRYDKKTQQMIYLKLNQCLVFNDLNHKLNVEPCKAKSKFQQFTWYGPSVEDFKKGIIDDPPRP